MGGLVSIRTEQYSVRPFKGLTDVSQILKPVRLAVKGNDHQPGAVVLPEEELVESQLTVRIPVSADSVLAAIESTGIPEVDCKLVVVANANGLRASTVIAQMPVDAFTDEVVIDRSTMPLVLQNKSGFKLTVAIVLLTQLQPVPMRPHLAGTWLAKETWSLSPERDVSAFNPSPLTDEIRESLRLPEGTLNFVEVSESVIHAENLDDEIAVYLDEAALNTLLANPDDPVARQMQADLAATTLSVVAAEMIRGIQRETKREAVSAQDLAEFPVAAGLFNELASRLGRGLNQTIDVAQKPDRLRAEIQSAFDVRKLTDAALREG